MQRNFFLVILSFYFHSCYSQNLDRIDSLSKYSYLLEVCTPKAGNCYLDAMATGFLIKDENNIYLVSAYHVFTGTNTTSNENYTPTYKEMVVRIEQNKPGKNNLVINLESLKEWHKGSSTFLTSDVYFYKTELNPETSNLYSIETILEENRDKKNSTREIVSYGYLNHPTDTTNLETYRTLKYLGHLITDSIYRNYSSFKSIDSLFFVSSPETFNGTSGSPVFFKYTNGKGKKKKEWLEFAGIMLATDPLRRVAIILKKEIFINEFKKYLKSHINGIQ